MDASELPAVTLMLLAPQAALALLTTALASLAGWFIISTSSLALARFMSMSPSVFLVLEPRGVRSSPQ